MGCNLWGATYGLRVEKTLRVLKKDAELALAKEKQLEDARFNNERKLLQVSALCPLRLREKSKRQKADPTLYRPAETCSRLEEV